MSSTTQVPLPAPPVPAPGGPRPVAWPTTPKPAKPAPKAKGRRWPLILALGVGAIAVAGTITATRMFRGNVKRDIQLYTVAPRSFPVILEEKGELKAANSIEIRSELEGKSTIINLVDEGTRVTKGQLLVELASDVIDSNIRDQEIARATALAAHEAATKELDILRDENASKVRKAKVALDLAQYAYDKYDKGDKVQLTQEATLAVDKAKQLLERAQSDYKDSQDLYSQHFLTKLDLDNDRFKAYAADLDLKNAELALQVLQDYTIPMAIKQAKSNVDEAQKDLEREIKSAAATEAKAVADVAGKKAQLDVVTEKLAKFRDQKSKAKILAPADGLVLYSRGDSWWRSETQIEKGASVYERQSLIELPDTTSMKVVIRVHEAQVENLKIGLPASVEIEGFANRTFPGRVLKIGVLADSQNRWLNPDLKEYETSILLDGTFGSAAKGNDDVRDLKPGVTARARVELAQLDNVLAVPVQAVFARNSKHFVFLDHNGTVEVAPVKVGLASTDYVEIKSGLKAGQVVRLAVTDEMKLMLPEDEGKANVKPLAPASRPSSTGGGGSRRRK